MPMHSLGCEYQHNMSYTRLSMTGLVIYTSRNDAHSILLCGSVDQCALMCQAWGQSIKLANYNQPTLDNVNFSYWAAFPDLLSVKSIRT